ncbi:MAG: chalcone isomerase family protein [Gammaproteobacteria bacterium]
MINYRSVDLNRALLEIWLGEKPVDSDLKRAGYKPRVA